MKNHFLPLIVIRRCIYGMFLYFAFIFKSKQYRSKVSAHCSRNEKGKKRRKGEGAIGCKYRWQRYISWIIRARWRKRGEGGESTTSERARVWKKRAESPENFPRSNTTSSRSEALLHYGTMSTSPPVCFCDISVLSSVSLPRTFDPKISLRKKNRLGNLTGNL